MVRGVKGDFFGASRVWAGAHSALNSCDSRISCRCAIEKLHVESTCGFGRGSGDDLAAFRCGGGKFTARLLLRDFADLRGCAWENFLRVPGVSGANSLPTPPVFASFFLLAAQIRRRPSVESSRRIGCRAPGRASRAAAARLGLTPRRVWRNFFAGRSRSKFPNLKGKKIMKSLITAIAFAFVAAVASVQAAGSSCPECCKDKDCATCCKGKCAECANCNK